MTTPQGGYAAALLRDWAARGLIDTASTDVAYSLQVNLLREMLAMLETILEQEGVPWETATRVIRSVLYGTPSVAEGQYRRHLQTQMADLLATQTPPPVVWNPDR